MSPSNVSPRDNAKPPIAITLTHSLFVYSNFSDDLELFTTLIYIFSIELYKHSAISSHVNSKSE